MVRCHPAHGACGRLQLRASRAVSPTLGNGQWSFETSPARPESTVGAPGNVRRLCANSRRGTPAAAPSPGTVPAGRRCRFVSRPPQPLARRAPGSCCGRGQPLACFISLPPLLWVYVTISPTALSWRLQSGHALPNSTFAGPFVSAKLSAWAPEPELELETAKRVIQPWAQMTRMLAPIRCQKHRTPRNHSWQEPCLRCRWSVARLWRRELFLVGRGHPT